MIRFLRRYAQYRKVGFGPIAAWRFAWLVTSGSRALPLLGR
jgi:hypothetical protein